VRRLCNDVISNRSSGDFDNSKSDMILFSYKTLKSDPAKFKYFTGMRLYYFEALYKYLNPNIIKNLKYKNNNNVSTPKKDRKSKLSDKDLLVLTLMRLRRGYSEDELAYFFKTSQQYVSVILYTWLQFLYVSFLPLKQGMFVTKEQIKSQKLPYCFKFFKNIRVVLDCTEFKIEHPSNFGQQGNTYSQYKSDNTHKVLLGIIPKGSFCFVSDCYEGSISDKELFFDCGIVDMLRPHDLLLVDRGFDIQAEMHTYNVTVKISPFLKKQSNVNT
jgi:hypothetical protein